MSDTQQPSSDRHFKLHYPTTKTTILFEPSGEEIIMWERKPKSNRWNMIAVQSKEYARKAWDWHVDQGAFRIQD